uniref:Uncharacterized protein n=1 Tax=Vespula pensylvanica TaxID=30213 RepID=A0A834UEV0_VESPE|nr:hypothetical protein H0235_003002 [Vespula pensylvanica]
MVTTSKTIDKDAFGIPAGLHLHNPNEQFRETCHEGYAADLREILENYSPWGKPGGGAPCPATLRKKNVLLEPLEPVKSHMAGQKSCGEACRGCIEDNNKEDFWRKRLSSYLLGVPKRSELVARACECTQRKRILVKLLNMPRRRVLSLCSPGPGVVLVLEDFLGGIRSYWVCTFWNLWYELIDRKEVLTDPFRLHIENWFVRDFMLKDTTVWYRENKLERRRNYVVTGTGAFCVGWYQQTCSGNSYYTNANQIGSVNALSRKLPLPHILPSKEFSALGWTSDSTIRKLSRKRDIDPLTVPDMNKFFDANVESDIASNLQSSRDTRSLYNEEVQVYKLTGGVELVPLLTSRRYHSQPQSIRYHVTDITRPGYTIESLRSLEISNRKYIAELAEQIRWKQDRACEERRAEQESCRRHFDTWRKLWGRPGHGAPIDHVHRNNLYNILYRPVIY